MRNKFERYGYWWLSNEEDNKIAGILSYTPNESPKLKLIGSFRNGEDLWQDLMNPDQSTLPNLILGKDAEGKEITLIVADRSGSWSDSSGLPIVDYTIKYCLIGIHLDSWDSNLFHSIRLELPLLTYWMNHFPVRHSYFTEEKRATGFDLSYNAEDNLYIYKLTNGIQFSIKHFANAPQLYTESSIIRQKYYVELEIAEPQNIVFFIKLAYRFNSFISIATLSDSDFDNLILYTGEKKAGISIELYFKQFPSESKDFKGIHKHKFLFFHTDVKDLFANIIDKWLSYDEKLLPIINHLVESIKDRKYFRSTDFLIVVQALEGYQRRFIDKNNHSKTSLEARLKCLKNIFTKDIKKVRTIDPKVIADTRNYYSHFYNEGKSVRILKTQQLYEATSQLKLLLYCCILFEMQLPLDKISYIIDKP